MSNGAGIKCSCCGARPYPELSLPEVVREDFDLLKIGEQWLCSEHRPPEKLPKKPRVKLSPIGEGLRKCRGALAEIVTYSDLDIETKERLCVVTDRLDRLAEGAADGH